MQKNLITGQSLSHYDKYFDNKNIIKYIKPPMSCVKFATGNNRPLIDTENNFFNLNKTI